VRAVSEAIKLLRNAVSRRHTFVAWTLLLLLCSGGGLLAGERIKIDQSSTNQVNLPKDPSKEIVLPGDMVRPQIGPGESSQGPALPPPGQPNMVRTPMFEEWLDHKKNWIYESPNSLDREKAIQKIFGVKDYDFSSLEKKPKGIVEKFMEGDKDEKGTGAAGHMSEPGKRDAFGKKEGPEGKQTGGDGDEANRQEDIGIMPALNPAPLFNWSSGPDNRSQFGDNWNRTSILPQSFGEPAFGQKSLPGSGREATPTPASAEKFWEASKLPAGRLTDPINSQGDATRSAINPIAARKASIPPPGVSQGRATEPIAFGNSGPIGPRVEPSGVSRSLPTAPLFAPPLSAPASTPVFQPKPAVLEIPRPKF
jgi:hypothetical protein